MFTWFYFQLLGGGGTLEMNIDGGATAATSSQCILVFR
jgi:hypothetical protein